MNYSETIGYLYNSLPMFSRMGSAAYKKDLHNTIALCEALGHPQNKFKSIHVAGTNGKGSVSHMLAAVLQASGYTTGLYTSPHLYDFRERIRVNGAMAEEDFVVRFVKRIQPLIEEIRPSFFEITVAMAFEYFAETGVDIAVIEVGLGGRLDSTNVIDPLLSVITNIGWDHTNILGDTLEQIAFEKAGIIKENKPVVVGEWLPQTRPVFEKIAAEKSAPLLFAPELFRETEHHFEKNFLDITYEKNDHSLVRVTTDLTGIYQVKNVRTVLAALSLFPRIGLSAGQENIPKALKQVKQLTGLQGRWETLMHQPRVVLEVAHNEDGIKQMLTHLKEITYKELHLVIGMVRDKDVDAVLSLLPGNARYYFTQASIPRALDAGSLQQAAAAYSLSGNIYADVNKALHDALSKAGTEDLIIVCGSIFLVAEVNRSLITQFA